MVGIGSSLETSVDPPSLLIIFSFTLGVLWIAGAPIGTMFSALFSASSTPEQLAAAARGWGLA
jgi:hypothetical protein